MKTMKYVMFELNGHEHAVILPGESGMTHADVSVHNEYGIAGKLISAGFCALGDDAPKCWGESVSLKLKSRPEDEAIIKRLYYHY